MEFIRKIQFLILSWTDKTSIRTSFYNKLRKNTFPYIATQPSYWNRISEANEFANKTANELSYQTQALLNQLLLESTSESITPGLLPSPFFTPLQNICLYLLAFGYHEKPCGAYQPFDKEEICNAVRTAGIFLDVTISLTTIQTKNDYLRSQLPIDCPRNEPLSRSCFPSQLATMDIEDFAEIATGLWVIHKLCEPGPGADITSEHILEQFPSLRKSQSTGLIIIHQSYHCQTTDDFMYRLENWTRSKGGRRVRLSLWQVFQDSMEPIELALILSDMLALWLISEDREENPLNGEEEDISMRSFSMLQAHIERLAEDDLVREDWMLLHSMTESLHDALEDLEGPSGPVSEFLRRAVPHDNNVWNDTLVPYFGARLKGKSHIDAMHGVSQMELS